MVRFSAFFSITMGVLMLGTWAVLFVLGQVEGFDTTPLEASMLVAAEIVTAAALMAGGWGILGGRTWGPRLNLVSLGMMLYTSIYSIGVFGQEGVIPAVVWFVLLTLTTFGLLYFLIFKPAAARNARPADRNAAMPT